MAQKHAEVPTVRRAAGRGEGGAHERQQVTQLGTGGAVSDVSTRKLRNRARRFTCKNSTGGRYRATSESDFGDVLLGLFETESANHLPRECVELQVACLTRKDRP